MHPRATQTPPPPQPKPPQQPKQSPPTKQPYQHQHHHHQTPKKTTTTSTTTTTMFEIYAIDSLCFNSVNTQSQRDLQTLKAWNFETLRICTDTLCSSILRSSAPRRRLHILPHWSLHLLLHCSTQNLYFAVIHSCTVAAHLHTCSVAQRRALFHIEARTGFSRICAAQYVTVHFC